MAAPSPITLAYSAVMALAIASVAGLVSYARKAKVPAAGPGNTKFFGSQVGGRSVINYSYTDMPWRLMAYDVYYFFTFLWALPHIVWPLTPTDSGELDELAFTRENLFALGVHFVLIVMQLGFIVSIPILVLLPIWTAALLVGLFFLVNYGICTVLNGNKVEFHSNPKYAPALPEHSHEQWIFINGVAAG